MKVKNVNIIITILEKTDKLNGYSMNVDSSRVQFISYCYSVAFTIKIMLASNIIIKINHKRATYS